MALACAQYGALRFFLAVAVVLAGRAFGQEKGGAASVRQLCEAGRAYQRETAGSPRAKASTEAFQAELKHAAPDRSFSAWPGKLIGFQPDGTGRVTISVGICPDGQGEFSVQLRNGSESPVLLTDPLVRSMQNLNTDDMVRVDGTIPSNAAFPPPGSSPLFIPTQFQRIEAPDALPPENASRRDGERTAHAETPVTPPPPPADAVRNPELVRKVEPKYTTRARNLGISCTVEVEFTVNLAGKPEGIHILKPCGEGLAKQGRMPTTASEAKLKDLREQRQQAITEAGLFRTRAGEVTDAEDRARLLRRAQQLETQAAELESSIATVQRQAETEKAKQNTSADENYSRLVEAAKDLDDNAVIAVMQYQFKPGTRNGQPVAIRASLSVEFKPGR